MHGDNLIWMMEKKMETTLSLADGFAINLVNGHIHASGKVAADPSDSAWKCLRLS